MPFKTKKKKANASRHRISLTESGFLTYSNRIASESSEKILGAGQRTTVDTIDGNNHVQMRSELTKIFLLSSVIIGLQIALKASNLSIFG